MATDTKTLFVNGAGPDLECHAHPSVLFSILDHHGRRSEDQTSVIGTLLGTNIDGVVEIRACFPVPHQETDGEHAVDMDFHKVMVDLHQKVNPKDQVIGWYTTASEISDASFSIHDIFLQEMSSPVLLLVDAALNDKKLSVKAFVSTTDGELADHAVGGHFAPVKVTYSVQDADRVGLNALMSKRTNEHSSIDSDLDNLETSVQKLSGLIDNVLTFVEDMISKGDTTPEQNAIGRTLMNAVTSIPHVDNALFQDVLSRNLKDLLMVVYLSHLAKTQVMISERLNA